MANLVRDAYGNPLLGENSKAEMLAKRDAGLDPNAPVQTSTPTNPLVTHNAEVVTQPTGTNSYFNNQITASKTIAPNVGSNQAWENQNPFLVARKGGWTPTPTAPGPQPPPQPTGFDPDRFLNDWNTQQQAIFGGVNFGQMSQQSADYLNQLATGQTQASRALQAQEAKAMSQGIQNLLNNISATAAGSGITGGALQSLYNKGLETISGMMGDFALANIARMDQNQQNAFKGFMELYGTNETAKSNMLSAYTTYQNLKNSNDQWRQQYNLDVSDRMIALMQESPELATIYSKYLSGTPLSQADIDAVANFTTQNWTMADLGNEIATWNELGIKTKAVPRVDANGQPVRNSAGQQIYDVEPVFNVATGMFESIDDESTSGGSTIYSRTLYDGYPNANYDEWKQKYVTDGININDENALIYFASMGNENAKKDLVALASSQNPKPTVAAPKSFMLLTDEEVDKANNDAKIEFDNALDMAVLGMNEPLKSEIRARLLVEWGGYPVYTKFVVPSDKIRIR